MRKMIVVCVLFVVACVTYGAAMASGPDPVGYVVLDGNGGELGHCAGRGSVASFGEVIVTDGIRWWYELDAPQNDIQGRLIVQFVCQSDNEKGDVEVLITHVQPWFCQSQGNIDVVLERIDMDGSGLIHCSGESLKRTVEQLLFHLTGFELASAYSVSDVFAEAMLSPDLSNPNCDEGTIMTIFNDENIRYHLEHVNSGRNVIHFGHDFGGYNYSSTSEPFSVNTMSHIRSEHNSGLFKGMFAHTMDNALISMTPITPGYEFYISTEIEEFVAGEGYCGSLKWMRADPFARIY